ncbi:hypothetical protein [Arthrobacter sp. Soil762]|uniref:hypothetical protein n=1 Tax=Arthrobacter sp. Soil762 TaxID=1736401 RepID=UPI000A64A339|nr:hypothetical protein [Arthrobacter sp. Soil762]
MSLTDAGIARPENQDIDELAAEISAENIGDADADWIFYSSYGASLIQDELKDLLTAG